MDQADVEKLESVIGKTVKALHFSTYEHLTYHKREIDILSSLYKIEFTDGTRLTLWSPSTIDSNEIIAELSEP